MRTVVPAVGALGLSLAAFLTTMPAHAAGSCVAQSVQHEHEVYGSGWGRDVVAFLATNPAVLQGLGFDSFGDLASFAASQDRTACPADL